MKIFLNSKVCWTYTLLKNILKLFFLNLFILKKIVLCLITTYSPSNNQPSLNFAKPSFPAQWQQQQQHHFQQAFTPSFQPPSPSYPRHGAKSPPFSLNDMSIRSVTSISSERDGNGNLHFNMQYTTGEDQV